MKLSDYRGEEAIEVLGDIIEPITAIFADPDLQEISKAKNANAVQYAKPILKNHKKEIIEILARLENEPVEEFKKKVTIFTLPKMLLDFLNDPEVAALFPSQHQIERTQLPDFGAVTENTGAKEN